MTTYEMQGVKLAYKRYYGGGHGGSCRSQAKGSVVYDDIPDDHQSRRVLAHFLSFGSMKQVRVGYDVCGCRCRTCKQCCFPTARLPYNVQSQPEVGTALLCQITVSSLIPACFDGRLQHVLQTCRRSYTDHLSCQSFTSTAAHSHTLPGDAGIEQSCNPAA